MVTRCQEIQLKQIKGRGTRSQIWRRRKTLWVIKDRIVICKLLSQCSSQSIIRIFLLALTMEQDTNLILLNRIQRISNQQTCQNTSQFRQQECSMLQIQVHIHQYTLKTTTKFKPCQLETQKMKEKDLYRRKTQGVRIINLRKISILRLDERVKILQIVVLSRANQSIRHKII